MHIEIQNVWWVNTIFAHMPESTSTTIEIMVKAGSIYEHRETNGLSHFLEHMFFKGGKKYPNLKVVAETIDAIWWEFNAYTGEEYAWYYVKVAPEYVNLWLDVLADMLVHAQFPAEELEREKWVIIQEMKMYEDMPHRHVIDLWKRWYYGDNAFWRPILWQEQNILSFTADHFFKHKEALYTKDNLVIIIAGNITDQHALSTLIAELFGKLPAEKTYETPVTPWYLPNTHQDHHEKGTQQNHLVIWAQWFSLHQEERYAASLLTTLLGGTMSSRLFQEIREKRGLCYYISASHDANDQDGTFMMRAGIEKARRKPWLEAIYNEIQTVADGNISEEEFHSALGNIRGKTKVWLETSDEVASFVGVQRLFKQQINTLEELLAQYEQVTLPDVLQVAKKLASSNLYAYWIE